MVIYLTLTSDIAAFPDSINVLDGVCGDIRTPEKLIDGVNNANDGRHTWLAPILPGLVHFLPRLLARPCCRPPSVRRCSWPPSLLWQSFLHGSVVVRARRLLAIPLPSLASALQLRARAFGLPVQGRTLTEAQERVTVEAHKTPTLDLRVPFCVGDVFPHDFGVLFGDVNRILLRNPSG